MIFFKPSQERNLSAELLASQTATPVKDGGIEIWRFATSTPHSHSEHQPYYDMKQPSQNKSQMTIVDSPNNYKCQVKSSQKAWAKHTSHHQIMSGYFNSRNCQLQHHVWQVKNSAVRIKSMPAPRDFSHRKIMGQREMTAAVRNRNDSRYTNNIWCTHNDQCMPFENMI